MAASATAFLRDYTVFNPSFYGDVVKFMDLQCTVEQVRLDIDRVDQGSPLTPEQIESGELTLKERLNALIDRVEFIGHLRRFFRGSVANHCPMSSRAAAVSAGPERRSSIRISRHSSFSES